MKKRIPVVVAALALAALACTCGPMSDITSILETVSTEVAPTIEAPVVTVDTPAAEVNLPSFDCGEMDDDFACYELMVPLDHADPEGEQISTVWAVRRATGERRGMLISIVGGPGQLGTQFAGIWPFNEGIPEAYDLVFYDQRGIGLSAPVECPVAHNAYWEAEFNDGEEFGGLFYDTPEEEAWFDEVAQQFATDCAAEFGDPARLAYYTTEQAIDDIEAFRVAMGEAQITLWGTSYGTRVAQMYADKYPQNLTGVILEATIDTTAPEDAANEIQENAFDRALVETLNACSSDPACSADMGSADVLAAYDALAARLAESPVTVSFPLPGGQTAEREFDFYMLESAASWGVYFNVTRQLYLRALAQALQGNFVPMLRLYYYVQDVDPVSEEFDPDPTFSYVANWAINCADTSIFPEVTVEERVDRILEIARTEITGDAPRMDGSLYAQVVCAYWPAAPVNPPSPEPITAPGVPVLILAAQLDPATPLEGAEQVFANLDNGYLFVVQGGSHSIYGNENACPDEAVDAFLLRGELPSERRTECRWEYPYYDPHEPIIFPDQTVAAQGLDNAMYNMIWQMIYNPIYFFEEAADEPESLACDFGGTMTLQRVPDVREDYTFENCAFVPGMAMTGTGAFDYESRLMNFVVEVSGDAPGALSYEISFATGEQTLTGTYNGQPVP